MEYATRCRGWQWLLKRRLERQVKKTRALAVKVSNWNACLHVFAAFRAVKQTMFLSREIYWVYRSLLNCALSCIHEHVSHMSVAYNFGVNEVDHWAGNRRNTVRVLTARRMGDLTMHFITIQYKAHEYNQSSFIYTVGHKKVPLLFLRYLWQMWTDFNNSFTFGFTDKLRNTLK